ncbi:MAG: hypothetical protein UH249_03100 [Acutalibacteraceae bacterium]|nr:hypothetical protein [Acutalibacteraceae bacterium]
MKQSKRLLCVLLSMLMMLSVLTVGASAYKTNYERPMGYDTNNGPYFSNDQCASAMLDFLDDEVFAGMNVNEELLGIEIKIYSLDSLFDSVNNITSSALYGVATILNLGDIEDCDWSIPKNENFRRRSATMSDLEFFGKFLQFVQVNADPLYKLIGNDLDLGLIGNFVNLSEMIPMLDDLHGFLTYTIYNLLIDPEMLEENYDKANSNLDQIINDFLANRAIKFICDMLADSETGENVVADFLGLETNPDGTLKDMMGLVQLCPSLTHDEVDITKASIYDFCREIFLALIDDIVIPFAGELLIDLLEIPVDDPTAEEMSYVDMVINLFVTYETVGLPEDASAAEIMEAFLTMVGCPNPAAPNNLDKINYGLEYVLKEGITSYVYLQDDGVGGRYLTIAPDLMAQLGDLLKGVLPILPTLLSDFPVLSEEDLAAVEQMNDEQIFAFAIQMILEAFVDGFYFPHNCNTIKELATYTLVNLAAEVIPSVDFEAKIESGELIPDSMQCLDVAAAVLRYYIVGQMGYIPGDTEPAYEALLNDLTPTFDELLNGVFDQLLGKFAVLFNLYPTEAHKTEANMNSPWYKLYMTVGQVIPLTNIFYGVEDSQYGMENLFVDSIIGNILNFDLNGLLGIIGRRTDSELNKPLSQALVNLIARVLNGLFRLPHEKDSVGQLNNNEFQLNLIVPYAYTTLDELLIERNTTDTGASYPARYNSNAALNGTGLQRTARMLLQYITNITGPGTLAGESLDLLATMIGIIDLDQFAYMKMHYADNCPPGTSYTIKQLRELYEELKIPDNDGLKYYDEEYEYFTDVDYALWAHNEFEDALDAAEGILNQYEESENNPDVEAPARADITYAYYALYYTKQDILDYYPTTANNYQLNKIYQNTLAANYSNKDADGNQVYTNRSWAEYEHALAFAEKVMNEYNRYAASGTLGDYPQSKVNMARAQLRDAVSGLKANKGDADYSELEFQLARLGDLGDSTLFTEESVQAVVDAFIEALRFNAEIKWDIDGQVYVDNVANALRDSIDNLQPIPVIEFYDPNSQFSDNEFKYIFGFGEDFYNEEERMMWGDDFYFYFSMYFGAPTAGDTMLIQPTDAGYGTGSKIQIASDPDGDGEYSVDTEYTMIMFGDITGDSFVDGQDAVLMRAYAASMLSVKNYNHYVGYAGDIDFSGAIGAADAKMVENAGLYKETINQAPEQYIGKTKPFEELIPAAMAASEA